MKYLRLALVISVVLFFAAVFFLLTSPISDPDFWWHLATGRWMAQHHSLMSTDPFNYLSALSAGRSRQLLILKGYWLAQLFMYATYVVAGFKGLVVLRALLYTAMFYLTWRLARMHGGGTLTSTAMVFLAALVIVMEIGYTGVRPQMISSVLAVWLLLVLTRMRQSSRWPLWAMPLTMLLWANMHGGYVFGWAIIGIFVFASVIERKATKAMLISSAAAIAVSLVNPCGLAAVRGTLSAFVFPSSSDYWSSIMETRSLFSHAPPLAILAGMPWLVTIAAVSVGSFVLGMRRPSKIYWPLVLLFPFVFYMGYKAVRFIVFFAPLAAIVAGMNFGIFFNRIRARIPERFITKLRPAALVLSIVAILAMSAWTAQAARRVSVFAGQPAYVSPQAGAVDFLRQTGMQGRLFNDYNYGGYLIWWLSPRMQVFADGRALSLKGFDLYRKVADKPFLKENGPGDMPVYRKVLDQYGVTLVLTSGVDRVSGVLIGLNLALLQDPDWTVVYADRESIIYARNTFGLNRGLISQYALPNSAAYDNMLFMAQRAASGAYGHIMPDVWLSMAVAYDGKGEYSQALDALKRYTQYRPNNMFAENLREKLMMEMQQGDK